MSIPMHPPKPLDHDANMGRAAHAEAKATDTLRAIRPAEYTVRERLNNRIESLSSSLAELIRLRDTMPPEIACMPANTLITIAASV